MGAGIESRPIGNDEALRVLADFADGGVITQTEAGRRLVETCYTTEERACAAISRLMAKRAINTNDYWQLDFTSTDDLAADYESSDLA